MKEAPLMLTLCQAEEIILVSGGMLACLGYPRQIQILINEDLASLIVQPCSEGARESILIPEEPMVQFEMPGRSLIRRIRRVTGWQDDCPRVLYGVHLPQPNAIIFDLTLAQVGVLQPVPENIVQIDLGRETGCNESSRPGDGDPDTEK